LIQCWRRCQDQLSSLAPSVGLCTSRHRLRMTEEKQSLSRISNLAEFPHEILITWNVNKTIDLIW